MKVFGKKGSNKVDSVASQDVSSTPAQASAPQQSTAPRFSKKKAMIIGLVILVVVATPAILIWKRDQVIEIITGKAPTIVIDQNEDVEIQKLITELNGAKTDEEKAAIQLAIADRYKLIGKYEQALKYYDLSKKYYESKSDQPTLQKIKNSEDHTKHQVEVTKKAQPSESFDYKKTPDDKRVWETY